MIDTFDEFDLYLYKFLIKDTTSKVYEEELFDIFSLDLASIENKINVIKTDMWLAFYLKLSSWKVLELGTMFTSDNYSEIYWIANINCCQKKKLKDLGYWMIKYTILKFSLPLWVKKVTINSIWKDILPFYEKVVQKLYSEDIIKSHKFIKDCFKDLILYLNR